MAGSYSCAGLALGLSIPQPLWLVAAFFLLVGGWLEARAWRAGALPAGVRCVLLNSSGAWSALGNDGSWSALELRRARILAPSVVRLRLSPADGTRGFDLELAADALPREIHRRLRVRLAWVPPARENVGRIPAHPSA